ncbi:MAG: adenylate cyclase, partial [Alphaproteobacteria bacterium]
RSPALILFEDAHWADPATLGFLGRLVDRIRGKRVLLLITHRPDFTPPWSAAAHIASIRLDGLGRDDCGAMVERLAGGKRLPETVIDEIVATTGGIPLYVEEVTKTLLASGMLEEGPDGYMLAGPLEPLTIPASLNDSLMARLDKLGHAKDVAQVAAILGRTFTRTQLTAISPVTEEELEGAIAQLVEADVIRPVSTHGGQAYDFRTPLLRDVAYQSLLLSKRRELHLRAAQLLERVYTGTSETEPELLAHHYASAGLNERAIAYWRRAAERASERYASTVAIGHLKRALDLLPALPETRSRDKHELVIRSALGTALLAVRGYAEEGVLINFTRARELAERIGSDHERFRAIRGLCLHSLMRGEHTTANRLADECLQLAEQVQDQPCVMEGHRLAGTCAFYTGRFGVSRVHMEKVVAIYDPRRDGHLAGAFGQDPGVMARIYLAWTLWITGHTEQALTTMNEAVALARQLGHPQSLILALYFATHLHLFRAEPADAQRHAASCLELARRDGLPFRTAMATIAEGCALAADGSFAKAEERLREGIALWRENGAELAVTLFAGTLANVCLNAGRLDGAWEALGEARQLEE